MATGLHNLNSPCTPARIGTRILSRTEPRSGCLFVIFKLLGLAPGGGGDAELPYQRADSLLSKAERSLFGVLQGAVAGGCLVMAKVRLADLVSVRRGTQGRQGHLNRILAKHVDFVLCDTATVRPLLVIELDDASHSRADRRDRDAFVDAALAAAGLPILHIPAQASYRVADLVAAIREKLPA